MWVHRNRTLFLSPKMGLLSIGSTKTSRPGLAIAKSETGKARRPATRRGLAGGVTEAGCSVGSIALRATWRRARATTSAASGPTPRRVAEAKEVWKGSPTK